MLELFYAVQSLISQVPLIYYPIGVGLVIGLYCVSTSK